MPRRKPTSNVGTALTRLNAVQRGLTAEAPVIPGVESAQEWQAHRAAIVDRPAQHPLASPHLGRL